MDLLLTGASGFIGAHVADELARRGLQVRAFCRSEPPPWACVSEWVRGDVTDGPALARAVRGCEAIIHAAALYSYSRQDAPAMEAVNVGGTRNVLEAAARGGIGRVLVTSISATCGPVPGRPAKEDDNPPRWELRVPYKRTKLAAERLALKAGAVCVNPTTVVGAGDRSPTPSGKMIRDLVEGRIGGHMRGGGLRSSSRGRRRRPGHRSRAPAFGHRLQGDPGGSGQIAQAPTSAGDQQDRCPDWQLQRRAGLTEWWRLSEPWVDQRADRGRLAGPRYPFNLPDGLRPGEQVQVDPGMGPVVQPGRVGDRGAHRNCQPAERPELSQGGAQHRILDYHYVGPGLRDRAPQPAPAEGRHREVGGLAGRGQLEEHPVGQLVAPADPVQVDPPRCRRTSQGRERRPCPYHHAWCSSITP